MSRHEPLRLRIYGESIKLRRHQWEELLDDMRPEADNARRIRELLAYAPPRTYDGDCAPDCASCNDTGYAENSYDACPACVDDPRDSDHLGLETRPWAR